MSDVIRVMLADDHPLVLDGIIARIDGEENIQVVGKASNGTELINQLDACKPDVVLLDLNMPVMNGFEATQAIRAGYPDIRILILSMHAKREYIMQLMQAGASGYVLKDVSSDELINAIKTVYQGNTHFSSGAAESLFGNNATGQGDGPLTRREETVLKLLADGKNNKQIARELDISTRTVEKHRQNIKSKLNIQTSSGLIRYAIEHNLVGLE